jgi:pimeloyl-ACP methyl ester carboxylesterase
MNETRVSSEYDLIPNLKQLSLPTLVIYGDHDVPVEYALQIAQAIHGTSFDLLREYGHFSYIEATDEGRRAMVNFF